VNYSPFRANDHKFSIFIYSIIPNRGFLPKATSIGFRNAQFGNHSWQKQYFDNWPVIYNFSIRWLWCLGSTAFFCFWTFCLTREKDTNSDFAKRYVNIPATLCYKEI